MKLKQVIEQSDSAAGRLFDLSTQALIVVSLLTFSFETLPDLSVGTRAFLRVVEIGTVVIFTVEYFARIAVAQSKVRFVTSFFGVIDFLAIMPFYLSSGIDLRAIRTFRLLRLVRILKLARYSIAMRRFHRAFVIAKEELILFFCVTAILLLLSAIGIYYFENQAQPKLFKSVFHSLWWSVSTLTTVGYGDIYPITVGGKVFTFAVLLVGLGIVSVPAGLISAALSRARLMDEREGGEPDVERVSHLDLEQFNCRALHSAWQFSDRLTASLESAFRVLPKHVAAVLACGSVKRMEAHQGSDLDLIVVIDDRKQDFSLQQQADIQSAVWEIVKQDPAVNVFDAPMAGGLFSVCASWRRLTDRDQRGVVDADITTFGHRMHVLMDAVPVAGSAAFQELQSDVLNWYSEVPLTSAYGGCPPFEWLKQDLLRYWHSLHAQAYWMFQHQPVKSATVNLKLRSSRLLQIAAFLVRLKAVEQVQQNERLQALLDSGTRSPLQTIIPCLTKADAGQLLGGWQNVWKVLESGITENHDPANWAEDLKAIREVIDGLEFGLT